VLAADVVKADAKPQAATAPATGPTTAASTAPATGPATGPTSGPTSAPATAPAAPPSKWVQTSEPKGDANDGTVDSLLQGLHPLRATKFLESAPTAPPAATYVVKVSTNAYGDQPAQVFELKLVETGSGADAKVIGTYQDLVFEVDKFFLDRVTADFTKKTEPPAALPPGLGGAPGLNFH